jgi:hypothetical protein
MKWRRLTIVLAAAFTAASGAAAAGGETVPVVSSGKSDWRIVAISREPGTVPWAARELQGNLSRMTGCELPIVSEGAPGPAFVLAARSDLSEADRAVLPSPAAGHDGYAVAIRTGRQGAPARVIIAGDSERGVIYGVYDVLERAGCRWCYPDQDPGDPQEVPRKETLALEAGERSVASPFRYRIANGSAWLFEMDLAAARKQLDWAMKCRYNAMGWQSESKSALAAQYQRMQEAGLLDELERRKMLLHGPGHCFDQFLRAEDHMVEHPEWFGLRDGKRVPQNFFGAQFCWSSAEARARFTDGVEAFVKACPRLRILYMVPFDGGKCCECAECRRVGASNLLMLLLGEVIDRLRPSAPGVLVETVGGYEPVTEPPRDAEIHPAQRILWAHWGRYHGRSYADPAYERRENLEAWRRAARAGLTVCQYYTDNFAEPWILPPFADAMRGDRRYLVESGIDSVYVLMWSPGYWWNHGLNGWLAGRCFYDASLDPYAEMRDHAVSYFGAQAGPLLAAYNEEWARAVDLAYHVRDGATDDDRATLSRQRRELIDPAALAVKDDPVLSRRAGKVEKLHTLAERLAEAHRLRADVRRLREGGQVEEARKRLEETAKCTEELLGFFRSLSELDQGLVDRNEVAGFISLRIKSWIEEERKALE